MNKLIIDNRTELSDLVAIELIKAVIELGRISNNEKQYSYGTTFELEGKNYGVFTDLNKKSDRFVIIDG